MDEAKDLHLTEALHASLVSPKEVLALRALVRDRVKGVDAAGYTCTRPEPENECAILFQSLFNYNFPYLEESLQLTGTTAHTFKNLYKVIFFVF